MSLLSPRHTPVHTPWGMSDDKDDIAPGIVRYYTPSHGGIHLSAERLAAMPPALAAIQTFVGHPWFEEDCDWCLPALSFPDHFSDKELVAAVDGFRTWHWRHLAWLQTPEAQALLRRIGYPIATDVQGAQHAA